MRNGYENWAWREQWFSVIQPLFEECKVAMRQLVHCTERSYMITWDTYVAGWISIEARGSTQRGRSQLSYVDLDTLTVLLHAIWYIWIYTRFQLTSWFQTHFFTKFILFSHDPLMYFIFLSSAQDLYNFLHIRFFILFPCF